MIEGLRIVIVEDDALIAMDLADLLVGMGHQVPAVARTETEAIAAALRHAPDLMIVDGILAEGSGVSAMRQILARGFVPHLYVSGDPTRISELAQESVIIAKPYNMRGLSNGIAQALRIGDKRAIVELEESAERGDCSSPT